MGAIVSLLPMLLPGLMDVIKRVVPDPAQQAQIQQDITTKIIDAQSALWQSSKDVMVADAAQDDKYTKRARPSVVYWSMLFTTLIAVLASFGHAQPVLDALTQVPNELWQLMTVGIGAFGLSRGVEKGISLVKKK
jgi:hypothetical protein